jgi:hypothetical protein
MADPVLDAIDNKKRSFSDYNRMIYEGTKRSLQEGLVEPLKQWGSTTLDFYNIPSQALIGGLQEGSAGMMRGLTMGKTDYNFQDMFPEEFVKNYPTTAAITDFGLQMVTDPTNLVGAGLIKHGGKLNQAAGLGAEASKGGLFTAAKNYIKNWYGLTDTEVPLTTAEQMTVQNLPNTLKRAEEKIQRVEDVLDSPWMGVLSTLQLFPSELISTASKAARTKIPEPKTAVESEALYRKVKGLVEWGSDAVDPVVQMVINPKARALYAEKGIGYGSQKAVREQLDIIQQSSDAIQKLDFEINNITKTDEFKKLSETQQEEKLAPLYDQKKAQMRKYNRAKETAVAQVGFNSHIVQQADRQGTLDESLQAFADTSSFTGYVPFNKENYLKAVENTKSTQVVNGKTIPLTVDEGTLTQAVDYIKEAWKKAGLGDNVKLMVKHGSSSAGNHISDVVSKNPSFGVLKKVFADFKTNNIGPTIESLEKNVKEATKGTGVKVLGSDDDGVWVMTSKVGGAIIEGGINILTKVTPSGRTISFMSDQHNFLENLPLLKRILPKYLPVDELSISQPIFGDILETNALKKIPNAPKFNKVAREGRRTRATERSTTGDIPKEERTMTYEDLVGFAYRQPSVKAQNIEELRNLGGGLLLGNTTADILRPREE